MNLDSNGLPCTLEEDGSLNRDDQLQRTAMLGLAGWIMFKSLTPFRAWKGTYTRWPGGSTTDLSGDALISALCYYVASFNHEKAWEITWEIIKRGGFSQNIYDMYGRTEKKTPDFILIRALPLMWRSHWLTEILQFLLFVGMMWLAWYQSLWFLLLLPLVSDMLLVVFALTSGLPVWKDDKGFAKRTPDDVDDNVIIMTFISCQKVWGTFSSWLACRIYAKLRPKNLGCDLVLYQSGVAEPLVVKDAYGPVLGALRWYHRGPRGNPEIAELYRPLVLKYFGESNPESV